MFARQTTVVFCVLLGWCEAFCFSGPTIVPSLSKTKAIRPTTTFRELRLYAEENDEGKSSVVVASESSDDPNLENFDSDSLRDARLKLDKIEKEQRIKGDVSASLAESPVQSFAIFLGAFALFLELGRLPAMLWLITAASLADKTYREELFEVLILKKPFGEASKDLTTQVVLLVGIVAVVILGEVSIGLIEPLKVTPQ
mmetsp:Transcript_5864/g.11029  ORF Transcript_5864/g.11029 Transcript_5864/m.11029 type:complete len:199 (+) Transcript_5864:60-656(+)